MSAICAGCLAPVRKGEKFRLAGTEVFHEQCVRLIANSHRVQLEQEIHRLRGELARERGSGAAARTRTHDLEREIERLRRNNIEDDRQLRRERDGAVARGNEARADLADTRRVLENAIRERDAARSELALHRTLGPAPAQVVTPAPTEKKIDDRDPTEARFSLIEPHET